MMNFTKPALALGLAGALAIAAVTPSLARDGRNAAAIGAGVAGFAVGAAVGSAAANSNRYYYGEPYAYGGGYAYEPAYTYAPAYSYDSYAYSPGPTYYVNPGVTQYNPRDPSSYYAPGGSYGPHSYTGWQNRERNLRAGDW